MDAKAYTNTYSVSDWLRRGAQYYPGKQCLVIDNERITYGDLDERVNRLTNGLISKGINKGDHIAFLFLNSSQLVETYFAIAKAGAVSVPLNTRLSGREYSYMMSNSDSKMLIYGSEFFQAIESIRTELTSVEIVLDSETVPIGTIKYEDLIAKSPSNDPNVEVGWNDGCVIYYTAGTTGTPKGAFRTHSNVTTCAANSAFYFGTGFDATWLGFPPWFHLGGTECFLLPSILTGARMVTEKTFDPVKVLELIEKEKVTTAFLVPAMSIMLLNFPEINKYDRSSVRVYVSGTAPTPEDLKRKILEYFPNASYIDAYGMTEAGLISVLPPQDALRKEMCVGFPIHNVRMRLVDDQDIDVPVGEVGEVILQGPQIFSEYYNDREKTLNETKGGWFHTGDLGRLDKENYLYLVDRKKDMIISGGENVYSAEVESVMFDHPKVLEAATIGLPDDKWGERVTAIVVLKEGQEMNEQELIDFCRDRLAHYKCPKQVIFLNEPLPRTSYGKVLKRELRSKYREI